MLCWIPLRAKTAWFRRPRTKDDDIPTIHYGVIASANQLIGDTIVRDKLTAEKNVLKRKQRG
jgi:hypothetical protein